LGEFISFWFYQQFVKSFPDHPDLLMVYQMLLPLVEKLQMKDEVERCRREIKRLASNLAR